MSRNSNLYVSALNVVLIDQGRHHREQYAKLFKSLYDIGQAVQLQGDRRLTIGSFIREGDVITGVLDRYTEIEREGWYNRAKRRRATSEEMGRIIVPEDMAANFQDFFYLFDTTKHLLVFLSRLGSKRLSARQAQMLFEALSRTNKIFRTFGSVAISIEQEPDKLSYILDADQLRYLSITINRPNSFGVYDASFEKKMQRLRAAKERSELWADDTGGLNPDKTIRAAAKVATSNGHVEGKIYEDGVIKGLSTEDMPVQQRQEFNSRKLSAVAAFRAAAEAMIKRLRKK